MIDAFVLMVIQIVAAAVFFRKAQSHCMKERIKVAERLIIANIVFQFI